MKSGATFAEVYQIVLAIPPGRVMTYGQISQLLEERLSAAGVGWALKATPLTTPPIPWHRVINARGGISTDRLHTHAPNLQRHLLEAEGVVFNTNGQIDLANYQWQP